MGTPPAPVAGRNRPPPDDARGATPRAAHPPRAPSRRESGRRTGVLAGAPARGSRSAGIAAHRQAGGARRAARRPGFGRRVRRPARAGTEHPGPLRRHLPHGRRRRGQPAGLPVTGARLVPAADRHRHGRLQQRNPDRRNGAHRSDHAIRRAAPWPTATGAGRSPCGRSSWS